MKFFYNGIKGSDGKLQGCSYSYGPYVNLPENCITIYGKKYRDFSAEVREAFTIENNSDCQTDYFENDRIRVMPSHPLYEQVKEAMLKHKAHNDVRFQKYLVRQEVA